MNLQNLTRDLDRLSAADAVVVDSYVRHILGKLGLYALAGVIATIGLGLVGLSLYWLLAQSLGPVGAAAVVGSISLALALVIFFIGTRLRPGREFTFALDVRRSAIQALEEDASRTPYAASGAYPVSEALISAVALPLITTVVRSMGAARTVKTAEPVAPKEPET